MKALLSAAVLTFFVVRSSAEAIANNGSFMIDTSSKNFQLDGHPFRYVSGSIHYFRCHPDYWNDRLKKIRAGGYNAVQVYVEWSYHEEVSGTFNFKGNRDIEKFIQLAKQNDLYVILRPGPYIDAERDMGGLPSWLLQLNPDVKLRTNDPKFMKYVERWFKVLFDKLKKYTIGLGGPIIMVQIENEYGSYATQTGFSDTEYLSNLRDLTAKLLGPSVLLFSTDPGHSPTNLRLSKIPGVYSTVDFGPKDNYTQQFHNQRLFEPNGPLVNSEFYTGWLDFWAHPHSTTASNVITKALDGILKLGANVNMYMIYGGTSFGFSAGADIINKEYASCPTSYDYDAPISEAGDLTQKYFDMKNVIAKYFPVPKIPVNKTVEKGKYGKVVLKPCHSLFLEKHSIMKQKATDSKYPLTFEALGHARGLVLYETNVEQMFKDPSKLSVPGIKDRGYVFVDGTGPLGVLDRTSDIFEIPLSIKPGQKLQIFVENMGRVCFGPGINDFKGITSNVTLNNVVLTNWTMKASQFRHEKVLFRKLLRMQNLLTFDGDIRSELDSSLQKSGGSMSFWQGEFKGCVKGRPKDTFLRVSRWKKGLAFVNGVNLGRYWPVVGPQQTLYVPAPILQKNCNRTNSIMLFEQEKPPCMNNSTDKCQVEFVTEPQLNGPTPIA